MELLIAALFPLLQSKQSPSAPLRAVKRRVFVNVGAILPPETRTQNGHRGETDNAAAVLAPATFAIVTSGKLDLVRRLVEASSVLGVCKGPQTVQTTSRNVYLSSSKIPPRNALRELHSFDLQDFSGSWFQNMQIDPTASRVASLSATGQ